MRASHEMFLDAMSRWRDLTCISYGTSSFTYAEILDAAVDYGEKLYSGFSLEGKIVAIRCSSAVEFLILFLSAIRKGAVVFPIGHDIPQKSLKHQLDIIGVDYLVSTLVQDETIPAYAKVCNLAADKIVKHGVNLLSSNKDNYHNEILGSGGFIRFTSGTTGTAKGVFVSFQSALERINAIREIFEIAPGEKILNLMPCAYHFIVSLLHFLSSGSHIMIPRSNTIGMILELEYLNSTRVIYAAPFHYKILSGLERSSLGTSLRLAISTGDSLDNSTADCFIEKFSVPISQAYGLIEVGLPIVSFLPDNDVAHAQFTGICYPPYQVKVDAVGNESRVDRSEGRLAIRGPGMFDAYLIPFKSRSEVLLDGWFYTGDIVSIDDDGRLKVLGRNSAVIKFMGHKVYPEEVEMVLNSHPSVVESRVYCSAKSPLSGIGEIIVADVVLDRSHVFSDYELKKYCREHMEKYKVPKLFNPVHEIEKTPTGKMRRL